MTIGRRGFIGGIIAAIAGGDAVVRLANPREQKLLATGDPARFLPPTGPAAPLGEGQFYLAMIGPNGIQEEFLGWANNWGLTTSVDSLVDFTFDGSVTHHKGLEERSIQLEMETSSSTNDLSGRKNDAGGLRWRPNRSIRKFTTWPSTG